MNNVNVLHHCWTYNEFPDKINYFHCSITLQYGEMDDSELFLFGLVPVRKKIQWQEA
jgi:hypothetical protein